MNKEEKQNFIKELKEFFSQQYTSDFDRNNEVFDEGEEDTFDFSIRIKPYV